MENTIKNAQLYFDELRHTEQPVFVPITTAGIMVAYTNKITASKDQRIAELKKENADLRRALSECKAKARIGVNPDRT